MWRPFILCLFLFQTACIKKPSLSEPGEILIGEYGSLTGSESSFGMGTHHGVEMAIQERNASGGVKGKKIRLITYDDEGKSDVAVTAVSKLVTQDRVHVIIGEVASTRSIAGGGVAQKYKTPMISPSSTNSKVTEIGDYIFRVCFIDPFQGNVLAQFAFKNLALKTAAILRDMKSDYSVQLANYFRERFEKLGGKVISEVTYSGGEIDFKSQLTHIRDKKPDVLFVPGYYTEAGLIARQARELNFKGVLLGGDGWDGEQLYEIGQRHVVGSYFSNHYHTDDPNPLVQNFVKKYREKYGMLPNSSAAMGYDAARVALDSMERAKEISQSSIRDAIASTQNFVGVTGKITIDSFRNAIKPAVIVKVVEGGKFEYVTSILPQDAKL